MHSKSILLVLFIVSCIKYVDGQEIKSKSKCNLISILMNSDPRYPSSPNNSTDSINLLDPSHLLDSCAIVAWRGFKINIINSGKFLDSAKRWELYFLTRNKPGNYYLVREDKGEGYWELIFHHG